MRIIIFITFFSQIGFMEECLNFWDHHLKGKSSLKQTNAAPKLLWYQCLGSIPPVPQILKWPGFWYSRNSAMTPDSTFKYYLNEGHLLDQQVKLRIEIVNGLFVCTNKVFCARFKCHNAFIELSICFVALECFNHTIETPGLRLHVIF